MGYVFQAGDYMREEKQAVRFAVCRRDDFNHGEILTASYEQIDGRQLDIESLKGRTPVGTVEFCKLFARRLDITMPQAMSYPPALKPFLGREVELRPFDQVPAGWFVKPVELKEFDGQLMPALLQEGSPIHRASMSKKSVWCSPPVKFIIESRFYVVENEIVGSSRYDDADDDAAAADEEIVRAAGAAYARNGAPSGYALDFGLTEEGETLLVEVNDGWALGFYRWGSMLRDAYARLITTRWEQIVCETCSVGI